MTLLFDCGLIATRVPPRKKTQIKVGQIFAIRKKIIRNKQTITNYNQHLLLKTDQVSGKQKKTSNNKCVGG